jgi:4-amino-4-deoxy-L-arabinose transferase-like glycosyltransferase
MLESGDWLHLKDLNGPFWNKPPLTMWLQAAGMAVFGVDSFAVRLPGLVFSLLSMFATFVIGRELANERRGVIAALLVGTSLSTHLMVLDPKVDAALTATTTTAIALMLVGRRIPIARLAAWFVAGLAVLSKGPFGLVIPVMALGPEVIRPAWGEGPWWRRIASLWPAGLMVTIAVVAPFYSATRQETGDVGLRYMLWDQGFGRLWGASGFNDDSTAFFFVHTGLWAFLPMTPLVVTSLFRRAAFWWRDRRLPGAIHRIVVWWFLLTFGVISLSTYKLPQYLYPLTPPAALLAAEELERLSVVAAARWRRVFLGLGGLTVLFVAIVLLSAFPPDAPASYGWVGASSAFLVLSVWWTKRLGSSDGVVVSIPLSVAVLLAFLAGYLQPEMLQFQPSRELGEIVRSLEPKESLIPTVFAPPQHAMAFYARRDTRYMSLEELAEWFPRDRRRLVLFGPEGDLATVSERGFAVEVIAESPLYATSRPSIRFLSSKTRPEVVKRLRLAWVTHHRHQQNNSP